MALDVWMLAWRRIDEARGHSMARVERLETGWLCYAAEVLIEPQETSACSFTVRLDQHRATREVEVNAVSREGHKHLSLRTDEAQDWWRDGHPVPALKGCVDIDIAAAPLTNTFPIRRLDSLAVGEQRTLPVAWVDVPTLQVTRVEQTYRRLAPDRWEYSDPTHGAFELSVDDHGFVVDYEGLASRVTHDDVPDYSEPVCEHADMNESSEASTPTLRQVVLDCEDARALAEFYRQLLGFDYRPGDEPPTDGTPDTKGRDWLVLRDATGTSRLAFQQVPYLPEPTWPEGPRPQMLHLDTTVPNLEDLRTQHDRALALGARLLYDRSDDEQEPLYVFADPAGHPFCIFVAP